jgi:hypothetical protein
MSQPNRLSTHIDKFLTDMSIAFTQDPGDYVAGLALPTKPVTKQSDKYVVYDKGAFLRDDAKLRKAGSESVGGGYSLSSDSYYCDKYALHVDVDWDELANADEPIDIERDSMVYLAEAMKIRREKLFADACFTTGVWTEDVSGAGTTLWTDYVASDPIKLVDQAKRNVRVRAARDLNIAIMGLDVFNALKEHPDFVDRIKYTSQDSIDEAMIAKRLGVSRVVVAKALVDSAPEGRGNAATLGFILNPKSMLLLHSTPSVGRLTPTAAARFAWTGSSHLPRPMGVASRKFDMDNIQATRHETEITEDIKVTAPDLGVFINNIVA